MTDNIKKFTKSKSIEFPMEGELINRLNKIIYEYEDCLSSVAVIGILELLKVGISQNCDKDV